MRSFALSSATPSSLQHLWQHLRTTIRPAPLPAPKPPKSNALPEELRDAEDWLLDDLGLLDRNKQL
ncbi:hypothetical protein [Devosia sp.]|uniref:hypothetical protein n=1 Tax=Devosia sp. TaxID=1871048 RepID=UPI003A8F939C